MWWSSIEASGFTPIRERSGFFRRCPADAGKTGRVDRPLSHLPEICLPDGVNGGNFSTAAHVELHGPRRCIFDHCQRGTPTRSDAVQPTSAKGWKIGQSLVIRRLPMGEIID